MKGLAAAGAMLLAALAVGGGAFLVWRRGGEADCADAVVAESRSPGGRFYAAQFSRRCGAAETTQVALRRAGTPFAPRDADVVFIAAGREAVKLSWLGDPETLVVETPARGVVREEHSWRKLAVQVRRVR